MNSKQKTRKLVIALAQRRQRPGSGSSLAALRERTARARFPDHTPVLGPIPWAVAGAAATRLYMSERATHGLGIVVRAEEAEAVRRALSEAGFEYQSELTVGGSSWLSAEGAPVDVVEMAEPWLAEALDEAEHNLDAQGLPVLPLRYLVLTKWRAGRVQDLADVTRMLGQASADLLASVRELFGGCRPRTLRIWSI